MIRNQLASAFHHLMRNALYSTISICGLALGLCAAILAGLVIRNHLTFDHFILDYENIYTAVMELSPQGRAPDYNVQTHHGAASLIKLAHPEVKSIARLALKTHTLSSGGFEAKEPVYWADAGAFELLRLPAAAGDLSTALARPDGVVLARRLAQKYFGQENVVGRSITFDDTHPMTVTAVIEDLPSNGTTLEAEIFASGGAAFSELKVLDDQPKGEGFSISVRTLFKLPDSASQDTLQGSMPKVMAALWSDRPPGLDANMRILRLDEVHLFEGLNPGIHGRIAITGAVGALILILACINFVNLSVARAGRRALEVGMRKVCGADRRTLAAQFLVESGLYVGIAMCVGLMLTQVALPHINALLGSGAQFDVWRAPTLLGALLGLGLLVTVLAGAYPAFILSALRPVVTLKGGNFAQSDSFGTAARGLVVFQFATLIGLLIAAAVIYQQRTYATGEALRVSTDQVLMIEAPCNAALKSELERVGGIKSVACTGWPLLTGAQFDNITLPDGTALAITIVPVDVGTLELFDLRPHSGRFFSSERADLIRTSSQTDAQRPSWVINEAAVLRLGLGNAIAAVENDAFTRAKIIGVVDDFALNSVQEKINPTAYVMDATYYDLIAVKLTGGSIPQTLRQIDELWASIDGERPIKRFFLNSYVQGLYAPMLREARAFGVFAIVAALLSGLGLFGLSASATERRTHEIGVRKAFGAGTVNIMQLLLWQFTKPVLWASLISWPLGAYLMTRWLQQFAYHTELSPLLFPLATGAALLIALLTVGGHCYLVARRAPAVALRYD